MLWSDPLDTLIEGLERAVPAASTDPHGHSVLSIQDWQDDHVALCRFVAALLWGGPDQLHRAEADPHVQRALANLTTALSPPPSNLHPS